MNSLEPNTPPETLIEQQARRKGRRILLIIFAIVFVPMLIAYIMWATDTLMPESTTNKGTLIQPVLHLRELSASSDSKEMLDYQDLNGRWGLLVIGDGPCAERCQEAIYLTRQVNIALGKEAERVEHYYLELAPRMDAALKVLVEKEYQRLHLLHAPRTETLAYLNGVIDARQALQESYIFVIDPLGNIMLYFSPANSGKDILTDMKKLLKNSKIG